MPPEALSTPPPPQDPDGAAPAAGTSHEGAADPSSPGDILTLLSDGDREMWAPILNAGTRIERVPATFVAMREDFRAADRDRFTYYLLAGEGEPLRPLRTSVQIREPLRFLLKWDESGILTLYEPDSGPGPGEKP